MNIKEFIQEVHKLNEAYGEYGSIFRSKMYALVHTYHNDIIGKVIFIDNDNGNDVIKKCLPHQTPVIITNVYPAYKYSLPYGDRLRCVAIRIRYKHLCVNYAPDDDMIMRVSSMSVTSGETNDIALYEDLVSYIKDNAMSPAEAEKHLEVKYKNFKNYLYLDVE